MVNAKESNYNSCVIHQGPVVQSIVSLTSFYFSIQLKSYMLQMTITSREEGPGVEATTELPPAPVPNDVKPFCKFVNAKLCGLSPHEGITGTQATVLLENPQGKNMLDGAGLLQQVICGTGEF